MRNLHEKGIVVKQLQLTSNLAGKRKQMGFDVFVIQSYVILKLINCGFGLAQDVSCKVCESKSAT